MDAESPEPRRHLHVVAEPAPVADAGAIDAMRAPAARPRTIGRLIATTALIADSAVTRRRLDEDMPQRGMAGRLLGRFR